MDYSRLLTNIWKWFKKVSLLLPSARTALKMARKASKPKTKKATNYLERIETEVQSHQSKLSLVLGVLIVLVVGILVFNFINKNKSNAELGPSQKTAEQQDVSPDSLPGKYTVKEGDTLFTVAEKYYQDGFKYSQLAQANDISNPDTLETGQVLEIPKLEQSPSPSPSSTPSVEITTPNPNTEFGPAIAGDTYTVVEGDWLSKIADRAYGNMMEFNKIAQANNISNPDLIAPGTVLTIPR